MSNINIFGFEVIIQNLFSNFIGFLLNNGSKRILLTIYSLDSYLIVQKLYLKLMFLLLPSFDWFDLYLTYFWAIPYLKSYNIKNSEHTKSNKSENNMNYLQIIECIESKNGIRVLE